MQWRPEMDVSPFFLHPTQPNPTHEWTQPMSISGGDLYDVESANCAKRRVQLGKRYRSVHHHHVGLLIIIVYYTRSSSTKEQKYTRTLHE